MDIPLIDRLPKDYTSNLALLPKDQREAMQEDKTRWLEAHKRYTTHSYAQLRWWIKNMPEGEYKDDMRRRLNIIKGNRNATRNGTR